MYIVAIAWLYVVFMMSITEQSAVAGVATFLLYGIFPLTVVLYLMGTPQRKRNRQKKAKLKAGRKEEAGYDSTMKREHQDGGQDTETPPR
ncbi:hypothetical protein G5B88_15175 [Herbaspirillum seropedicae]|uniref:hypothetical protein n=1 Tax=Herbaspirillum seropedicae TaxID=964 RepID=UPI0002E2F16D|nr:hypothetical protein [Herbaspirillum seropedicae]AKN66416.1 membrane protein [Herbaspirillum seropedicae]MDR6393699.1 hypothetical protein [Herbaspirillum seropedicae]NQE30481.1 membrane protein [Herbaspirillum seropedicae]UMU22406.1 hypothetical protein G5B88_15175 [Herbaspirillum seropedicae]